LPPLTNLPRTARTLYIKHAEVVIVGGAVGNIIEVAANFSRWTTWSWPRAEAARSALP